MNNILVVCDFSEAGNHACKFAIEFASASGSNVVVAHIIETFSVECYVKTNPAYKDQVLVLSKMMETAENDFEILRNSFGIDSEGVVFLVEVGSLKECISKIIKDHMIELIIMRNFIWHS